MKNECYAGEERGGRARWGGGVRRAASLVHRTTAMGVSLPQCLRSPGPHWGSARGFNLGLSLSSHSAVGSTNPAHDLLALHPQSSAPSSLKLMWFGLRIGSGLLFSF